MIQSYVFQFIIFGQLVRPLVPFASKPDYDDLAYNMIDLCPPVACFGINCTIVTESNGCKTCACPIGSRARGCDQMPLPLFAELMEGGCPDPDKPYAVRPHPKVVLRFYRYKNSKNSIDECRSYLFPFCQKSDYNLWRSPLTVNECEFMCYTEIERQRRRRRSL